MDNETIIKRIEKLEKDILVINENFKNVIDRDKFNKDRIEQVKSLCIEKIKNYNSILLLFGKDEQITSNAKIEKDLAQQIYTILF